MKLAKFYEKAEKIFDSMSMSGEKIHYYNTDDGMCYFCDSHGFVAYVMDGGVLSVGGGSLPLLKDLFENAIRDGELAQVTYGKIGRRKARSLASKNYTAFVAEKRCKEFPKNTLFYISGLRKPVLAAIWEDGAIHPIGIVMPLRASDFCAA